MSLARENRDRIQSDARRIAQLEATLKLVKDRASWGVDCATTAENDTTALIGSVGRGLIAQCRKIVCDVDGVL